MISGTKSFGSASVAARTLGKLVVKIDNMMLSGAESFGNAAIAARIVANLVVKSDKAMLLKHGWKCLPFARHEHAAHGQRNAKTNSDNQPRCFASPNDFQKSSTTTVRRLDDQIREVKKE